MINFRSKLLIAARVLAAKDWSAPKVILAARHMAHDGATTEEIRDALWPNITVGGAYSRLRKFNIRGGTKIYKRARLGERTSLPPGHGDTDSRSFKARTFA